MGPAAPELGSGPSRSFLSPSLVDPAVNLRIRHSAPRKVMALSAPQLPFRASNNGRQHVRIIAARASKRTCAHRPRRRGGDPASHMCDRSALSTLQ